MDNQPSPPQEVTATPTATPHELGFDDTGQFDVVLGDGIRRLAQGLPPVLPYKDITDPRAAYSLARLEWHLRSFIQQQQGGSHLLPDAERLGRAHYRIHPAPWLTGLEPITALKELALEIVRMDANRLTLEADMNGVTVRVHCCSEPHLLHRDWQRALDGCISGPVGPEAPAVLTLEEVLSDEHIRTANQVLDQARRMTLDAKFKARKAKLDARLQGLPEMEIGNLRHEHVWQEAATTEAQQFVINFGKTWARLMQAEMAADKPLGEVIVPTFHLSLGDCPVLTSVEMNAVLNYVAYTWAYAGIFRKHIGKISTAHRLAEQE